LNAVVRRPEQGLATAADLIAAAAAAGADAPDAIVATAIEILVHNGLIAPARAGSGKAAPTACQRWLPDRHRHQR
jgi:hypothetical protein